MTVMSPASVHLTAARIFAHRLQEPHETLKPELSHPKTSLKDRWAQGGQPGGKAWQSMAKRGKAWPSLEGACDFSFAGRQVAEVFLKDDGQRSGRMWPPQVWVGLRNSRAGLDSQDP